MEMEAHVDMLNQHCLYSLTNKILASVKIRGKANHADLDSMFQGIGFAPSSIMEQNLAHFGSTA